MANRIATRSFIATCASGSRSLNQGLGRQETELRLSCSYVKAGDDAGERVRR
jgi:hypothetical protein